MGYGENFGQAYGGTLDTTMTVTVTKVDDSTVKLNAETGVEIEFGFVSTTDDGSVDVTHTSSSSVLVKVESGTEVQVTYKTAV